MAQSVPGGAERRKFGRKACRVLAEVKTAKNESIACVVLDYSHGGARLEFEMPVKLGGQFDLFVAELNLAVPCTPRHNFGRTIGIEFVEQPGRRSLCSALGTQKLLSWLDRHDCKTRLDGADGTARRHKKSDIGRHPLRTTVYAKPGEPGPVPFAPADAASDPNSATPPATTDARELVPQATPQALEVQPLHINDTSDIVVPESTETSFSEQFEADQAVLVNSAAAAKSRASIATAVIARWRRSVGALHFGFRKDRHVR